MATKKKTAVRKKAPPQERTVSAAELHELARVQRRRGDTAVSAVTLELARTAERREEGR